MAYIGTTPKDVRSFGKAKFDFTATASQTVFTGADDDGKTLGFTAGQISVYVNGILMDDSDFTVSNGNTVTLASPANAGDIISVVALQTDIPNSDYVPATGGTFSGAVVANAGLTVDNNNATVLTADRATSDGSIVDFKKDGTTVGSIGTWSGISYIGSGDAGLAFAFGNDDIRPFNPSTVSQRDAAISLGESGTRFKDLYLSGGVYLGGTGSANLLDDYEEGSFSPMTSTLANVYHARYTKIGNLVTINCNFQMKVGQARNYIDLPFTPANDGVGMNTASNDQTNNRYAGTVSYFTPASGSTPVNLMLFHQGNQGAAAYFLSKSSDTQQSWPKTVDDTFGNISVSFTYQTA